MASDTWKLRGLGYSELDQITPKNVNKLQLAWVFSTGHEAAPLVNNGVMYVSMPGNQVFAINANTGTLLWRYRREIPPGAIVMHPVSRGVPLFGDKVFFASNAAVLVALDATLPSFLPASTVEQILKRCDRKTSIGRRNYATLLLLARLGVRRRSHSPQFR